MTRVSLMGSFIDVINAIKSKSEENEIKKIFADRESILKQYGDKRLLAKTIAEKEFEKISKDKVSTGIRTRVKTSETSNGGNGKNRDVQEVQQPTIESNGIERDEK